MNGVVISGAGGAVVFGAGGDVVLLTGVAVDLYAVSATSFNLVGRDVTDTSGIFAINPSSTSVDGTFYAVASVRPGVFLTALLGPELPAGCAINELTTVAMAYSAAQLLKGPVLGGSALALRIAAAMSANVADVGMAKSSLVLLTPPNADQTNALRASRSLANLLAGCVRQTSSCSTLYQLATPPGGTAPADTLTAMSNIALNPGNNVAQIYAQSQLTTVYDYALTSQPDAWTLAVKVNDSGSLENMFGGPANIAFDSKGNAWISNNVVQGSGTSSQYCMVLGLDGRPARDANGRKMSPFTGGDLLGAGFGVALDSQERVWIGSFGWGGDNPGGDQERGTATVFDFSNGTPPAATGYAEKIYKVQATVVDDDENVWLASYGNSRVVVYPGGDGTRPIVYDPGDSSFLPFGIAIDTNGLGWVTDANSSASTNVQLQLDTTAKTLTPVNSIAAGMQVKGIAIDSYGVIWLASGADSSVYAYKDGVQLGQFTGGSLDAPWDVTVDGNGDVWVANFGALQFGTTFSGRLTKLAGYASPSGQPIGTELTPTLTGYTLPTAGQEVRLPNGEPLYGKGSDPITIPLMRVTSLNIDAAGNIWAVNNWKPVFNLDLVGEPLKDVAANPGGDGIVIFLGLAPPPV